MGHATLTTTIAVMNALGGAKRGSNQRIADLTGRTHKAVSNWRTFDTFPPDTYLVMTEKLAELGYSAPASLWRQVEAVQPQAAE